MSKASTRFHSHTSILEQLAPEIAAAHAAVVAQESGSLAHAKKCGDLLITAKREVEHGGWKLYVEGCGLSVRVAELYMQVARGWPQLEQKRNGASHFSLREALRLLQTPRANRTDPVPRVHWKELTKEERREVRRISVEMAEFPFVRHTFVEQVKAGGTLQVIPGAAGTPVYWDLVGGDPKSGCPYFKYTRHDVCVKLEAFVDGGPRSVVSDLAVDVARRRIAGDRSLSRPWLWLDDDTVTLSQRTQEQCAFLAPIFNARSLDEVVAAAVDFAHFSYSLQLDDDSTLVEATA